MKLRLRRTLATLASKFAKMGLLALELLSLFLRFGLTISCVRCSLRVWNMVRFWVEHLNPYSRLRFRAKDVESVSSIDSDEAGIILSVPAVPLLPLLTLLLLLLGYKTIWIRLRPPPRLLLLLLQVLLGTVLPVLPCATTTMKTTTLGATFAIIAWAERHHHQDQCYSSSSKLIP